MFSITLSNYNCKIKITSVKDGVDLGTITGLKIKRKEYGDSTWTLLTTKSISIMDDFNYVFIDKYTLSRRTYVYSFIPMSGSTEETAVEYTIECNFDSIYIYDASDEYLLTLNLDYDYDSNEDITFQKLLQSKYPRRIQNGLSDYYTGYIEGIPLPLDANGNPTSIGAHKYKQAYISFLRNGLDKFIKTYKGDAWLVSVNASPKVNQDVEGAESIRFSWTQIGDTPEVDT